ncbi:hypothetical protein HQ587_09520 [bacterium]|nr:hypothetical protein [bacterium]
MNRRVRSTEREIILCHEMEIKEEKIPPVTSVKVVGLVKAAVWVAVIAAVVPD